MDKSDSSLLSGAMDNDLIDISNHYEAQEAERIHFMEQEVLDELNRIMSEVI